MMLIETLQAADYIEQYYAVSISQDDTGRVVLTDWSNFTSVSNILGLAITQAYAGNDAQICLMGIVENPNWDWIPGKPVYAFASGTLTQNLPIKNVYKVGNAISTKKIFVKPSEFIMVTA